jgi:hypothetical protein
MSKLDAQRAMREANYARNKASGPSRGEAPPVRVASAPAARTPAPRAARAAAAASALAASPTDGTEDPRCGHKSMNGRACTREAAHPEKNHRYS